MIGLNRSFVWRFFKYFQNGRYTEGGFERATSDPFLPVVSVRFAAAHKRNHHLQRSRFGAGQACRCAQPGASASQQRAPLRQ